MLKTISKNLHNIGAVVGVFIILTTISYMFLVQWAESVKVI